MTPMAAGDLASFGHDPWWLMLFKAVMLFIIAVVFTLFNIWYERRLVAKMQHRVGPNMHGPFGLLQSLADGVKLALKEDLTPVGVDKIVFVLAPVISVTTAIMAFAVLPFGPEVSMFGHRTHLQLTDMPVGVLYILAVGSIGIYGIVLAGWSSGSTYPLLGGLRSSAQMISYEVAMGLSLVAVFLFSGSISTSDIVNAQAAGTTVHIGSWAISLPSWYAIVLFPSFCIYVISMVGETNRAPFDLPEAEGELVGGFHTEYSSLKFALFFLAEYTNMVIVSALATTMFLGGWRAPWPISEIPGVNEGWWPILWFVIKIVLFISIFVWLRGTLPRYRYDQFMAFGWRWLIPIALIWILFVAAARATNANGHRGWFFVVLAAIVVVLLAASFVHDMRSSRRESEQLETEDAELTGEFDAFAGGFPVPPMPGQRQREPAMAGTADARPGSGAGGAGSSTSSSSEGSSDDATPASEEDGRS